MGRAESGETESGETEAVGGTPAEREAAGAAGRRVCAEADAALRRGLKRRLRAAMERRGEKSSALARRAHLSPGAVRDILSGRSRNPGIVTLRRIAEALETPLPALIGGLEGLGGEASIEEGAGC